MQSVALASWLAWLSVISAFLGFDLLQLPHRSYLRQLSRSAAADAMDEAVNRSGRSVAGWLPRADLHQLEARLIWADLRNRFTPEGFVGVKVLAAMSMLAVALLLAAFNLPAVLVPVLAVLGYWLPDVWLNRQVETRQRAVRQALPDLVDLLGTALRAGMELGPALERVLKKFPGPLGAELQRAWREIVTGRSQTAALMAVAERTGVWEVERFVRSLVIAREQGSVSLADALSAFAAEFRASRQRRAEEEARKLPTKMLLPLTLCIFLPMLAVLLAPVAVIALQLLSQGF